MTAARARHPRPRTAAERRASRPRPLRLLGPRPVGRSGLTARERIGLLLDAGSFAELEVFRAQGEHGGVIAGSGTVDGRRVFVYAQDDAAAGPEHTAKVHRVMDLALAAGAPLIGITDGARVPQGPRSPAADGATLRRHVEASGVIPQISVVLGAGGAYSPVLADFTFAVGQDAGAGLAGFVHDDEEGCLHDVRYLVSLLPSNSAESAPAHPACGAGADERPRLAEILPPDPDQPYDMREVLAELVDDGEYIEVHEHWAGNVVCALGRVDGEVVGVVGNQPTVLAGALDGAGARKAARFVRFCDAFGIPLVTLVDVPGFAPGDEQDLQHGAKLLYAYCEASVPRVQVVVRKAYGEAYTVMDSRSVGTDLSLAWPTNVITENARSAELLPPAHPHHAAEWGLVDDVIDPVRTRAAVARGLSMLRHKRTEAPRRKHGNIPL
ncbi:acyl-CoA carboxylase subunit beta [Actinokineospora guangxiensis]|uniref:Acyl-CoA carboxylase subunit beta n=1 Tax=Actinokineospora guangxiensis TaxID=1490288 RepID=A0ABW0EQD4_9PSEU